MSTPERVRAVVEPIVADLHLDLYDLELAGGVLRVVVDQPGGVGMDAITAATKAISRALDEHDPIGGHYTLEVSSPGLERTLRTPAHFAGAVGDRVTVKTAPGTEGDRRVRGTLREVDGDAIVVVVDGAPDEPRRIALSEIERARTVFEWGPAPKPGKGPGPGKAGSSGRADRSTRSDSSSAPRAGGKAATAVPTSTTGEGRASRSAGPSPSPHEKVTSS